MHDVTSGDGRVSPAVPQQPSYVSAAKSAEAPSASARATLFDVVSEEAPTTLHKVLLGTTEPEAAAYQIQDKIKGERHTLATLKAKQPSNPAEQEAVRKLEARITDLEQVVADLRKMKNNGMTLVIESKKFINEQLSKAKSNPKEAGLQVFKAHQKLAQLIEGIKAKSPNDRVNNEIKILSDRILRQALTLELTDHKDKILRWATEPNPRPKSDAKKLQDKLDKLFKKGPNENLSKEDKDLLRWVGVIVQTLGAKELSGNAPVGKLDALLQKYGKLSDKSPELKTLIDELTKNANNRSIKPLLSFISSPAEDTAIVTLLPVSLSRREEAEAPSISFISKLLVGGVRGSEGPKLSEVVENLHKVGLKTLTLRKQIGGVTKEYAKGEAANFETVQQRRLDEIDALIGQMEKELDQLTGQLNVLAPQMTGRFRSPILNKLMEQNEKVRANLATLRAQQNALQTTFTPTVYRAIEARNEVTELLKPLKKAEEGTAHKLFRAEQNYNEVRVLSQKSDLKTPEKSILEYDLEGIKQSLESCDISKMIELTGKEDELKKSVLDSKFESTPENEARLVSLLEKLMMKARLPTGLLTTSVSPEGREKLLEDIEAIKVILREKKFFLQIDPELIQAFAEDPKVALINTEGFRAVVLLKSLFTRLGRKDEAHNIGQIFYQAQMKLIRFPSDESPRITTMHNELKAKLDASKPLLQLTSEEKNFFNEVTGQKSRGILQKKAEKFVPQSESDQQMLVSVITKLVGQVTSRTSGESVDDIHAQLGLLRSIYSDMVIQGVEIPQETIAQTNEIIRQYLTNYPAKAPKGPSETAKVTPSKDQTKKIKELAAGPIKDPMLIGKESQARGYAEALLQEIKSLQGIDQYTPANQTRIHEVATELKNLSASEAFKTLRKGIQKTDRTDKPDTLKGLNQQIAWLESLVDWVDTEAVRFERPDFTAQIGTLQQSMKAIMEGQTTSQDLFRAIREGFESLRIAKSGVKVAKDEHDPLMLLMENDLKAVLPKAQNDAQEAVLDHLRMGRTSPLDATLSKEDITHAIKLFLADFLLDTGIYTPDSTRLNDFNNAMAAFKKANHPSTAEVLADPVVKTLMAAAKDAAIQPKYQLDPAKAAREQGYIISNMYGVASSIQTRLVLLEKLMSSRGFNQSINNPQAETLLKEAASFLPKVTAMRQALESVVDQEKLKKIESDYANAIANVSQPDDFNKAAKARNDALLALFRESPSALQQLSRQIHDNPQLLDGYLEVMKFQLLSKQLNAFLVSRTKDDFQFEGSQQWLKEVNAAFDESNTTVAGAIVKVIIDKTSALMAGGLDNQFRDLLKYLSYATSTGKTEEELVMEEKVQGQYEGERQVIKDASDRASNMMKSTNEAIRQYEQAATSAAAPSAAQPLKATPPLVPKPPPSQPKSEAAALRDVPKDAAAVWKTSGPSPETQITLLRSRIDQIEQLIADKQTHSKTGESVADLWNELNTTFAKQKGLPASIVDHLRKNIAALGERIKALEVKGLLSQIEAKASDNKSLALKLKEMVKKQEAEVAALRRERKTYESPGFLNLIPSQYRETIKETTKLLKTLETWEASFQEQIAQKLASINIGEKQTFVHGDFAKLFGELFDIYTDVHSQPYWNTLKEIGQRRETLNLATNFTSESRLWHGWRNALKETLGESEAIKEVVDPQNQLRGAGIAAQWSGRLGLFAKDVEKEFPSLVSLVRLKVRLDSYNKEQGAEQSSFAPPSALMYAYERTRMLATAKEEPQGKDLNSAVLKKLIDRWEKEVPVILANRPGGPSEKDTQLMNLIGQKKAILVQKQVLDKLNMEGTTTLDGLALATPTPAGVPILEGSALQWNLMNLTADNMIRYLDSMSKTGLAARFSGMGEFQKSVDTLFRQVDGLKDVFEKHPIYAGLYKEYKAATARK